jgi:transposase
VSGFAGFSRHTLLGICAAQAELLAEQDRRLAVQAAQLAELRDEVARLQRRLSRNSRNSSMPPSADGTLPGTPLPDPSGKPGGPDKPPAARKRGRQPGARGSALGWAPDATVEDHRPQGPCRGCGTDLAGTASAGVVRSWQVTDIPVVTATVTEHRVHAVVCGCGTRTVAAPPADAADAACRYGPNLAALVVYLLVTHAVPVERAAALVADVTGARPSTGWVHGLLAQAAARLARPLAVIHTGLQRSDVVHFDETTLRVGSAGGQDYVWVAATDRYTLYHLGARSAAAFVEFGIGLHLRDGTVVVHDGYTVYDSPRVFDQTQVVHQLCVAHLLRHLTDAAQTHPTHTWPTEAATALRALVHAHHTARDAGLNAIPAETADPLIDNYHAAVAAGLAAIPRRPGRQLPARSLLETLEYYDTDVLRFCHDTRIPPTNNQAERDLRPHKTQQKISGRLTSEPTTRDRLAIRSYLSTAAKHGRNALTTLRQAILGDPWIPPIPTEP